MIIDVFPFADEVDLATLRIEYLQDVVDVFVVSEHSVSFSGHKKDFFFPRVLARLSDQLSSKVIYLQDLHTRAYPSPFQTDSAQKNAIGDFVRQEFDSNTKMLFGDLDEVPRLESIAQANKYLMNFPMLHFAQDFHFGFFNVREISGLLLSYAGEFEYVRKKKWLGTILTTVGELTEFHLSSLRDPGQKQRSLRLSAAGWHFSNCNGESLDFLTRFRQKMDFSAHQEFNRHELIALSLENLRLGKDPLYRKYTQKIGCLRVSREPKFSIDTNFYRLPSPFILREDTKHFFLDKSLK